MRNDFHFNKAEYVPLMLRLSLMIRIVSSKLIVLVLFDTDVKLPRLNDEENDQCHALHELSHN